MRALRGTVEHSADSTDDDRRGVGPAQPPQAATGVLPFAVRKSAAETLDRRQLQLVLDRLAEALVALREIDYEVEVGGRDECAQIG